MVPLARINQAPVDDTARSGVRASTKVPLAGDEVALLACTAKQSSLRQGPAHPQARTAGKAAADRNAIRQP